MRKSLLALFIVVEIGALVFILATSGNFPDRVASHFARGGEANGWMPRETYVTFILVAGTGVPLALVALLAWLPRAFPSSVNLPNRAYWLAAERRDATLASISGFAWAFGSMLTALVAAVHWAVVRANASAPPRLQEPFLWALLIGFASALAVWILAWYLRFRRPS